VNGPERSPWWMWRWAGIWTHEDGSEREREREIERERERERERGWAKQIARLVRMCGLGRRGVEERRVGGWMNLGCCRITRAFFGLRTKWTRCVVSGQLVDKVERLTTRQDRAGQDRRQNFERSGECTGGDGMRGWMEE
jgi:hypothetical protein